MLDVAWSVALRGNARSTEMLCFWSDLSSHGERAMRDLAQKPTDVLQREREGEKEEMIEQEQEREHTVCAMVGNKRDSACQRRGQQSSAQTGRIGRWQSVHHPF